MLRMPKIANFAHIIKLATMFTRATFKDSKKKVKRIRNFVLKCIL